MDKQQEVNAVLDFWFGEIENELSDGQHQELWYQGSEALDNKIKQDFFSLYQKVMAKELDHWQQDARGSLALVILLDQLPRNMFRGTARAFASDELALQICKAGIKQGLDLQLSLVERVFYYHPFQHSESLAEQQTSVDVFIGMLEQYRQPEHVKVIENSIHWAREHLAIIRQFGRFPHRNKAQQRASTAQELEYLKSGFKFGQG
ncbi:DUF924 domain-containing protein [Thalassomonas viridans]|uniref:DUF924 domain-containing protein n=1 Tax=Thalassomonas viridans TaxID=137584 RepID=A0AAF0CBS9_9GAMM|nr:DUF924 family protein [Thalassomonas viridans]WDE06854.1 DUF924 domain-containing protein [Thalassomonas viridans]